MNQEWRNQLHRIFDALGDNTSRNIFKHRLLYSLLGDRDELAAIVSEYYGFSQQAGEEWIKSPKICYYGAGAGGKGILEYYSDIPFFIDTYKTGEFDGKPIISLDDFLKLPDCKDYLIVITVGNEEKRLQIETNLKTLGLKCFSGYFGVQYFDLPYLSLKDGYFVDAGAFDGETTQLFLEQCENGYSYVFEPNLAQVEITKERLNGYQNIEIFPYGLYNENTTLRFESNQEIAARSRTSETGDISVEVRRLDDVLQGKKVTFIKMDIEGSELAALQGAEKIIREQKPDLAICVYHKPEDIWEIPDLILKYCPDYKLYLRHYSAGAQESVLYAII